MDHRTWLWRKKSAEKTIVLSDRASVPLKGYEKQVINRTIFIGSFDIKNWILNASMTVVLLAVKCLNVNLVKINIISVTLTQFLYFHPQTDGSISKC